MARQERFSSQLSEEIAEFRYFTKLSGADVDLQEGQDLIAIDLVGPKLAKGVLQCWLGARHHPSAPPALECALPSQGQLTSKMEPILFSCSACHLGLNHAHVFFEARTGR